MPTEKSIETLITQIGKFGSVRFDTLVGPYFDNGVPVNRGAFDELLSRGLLTPVEDGLFEGQSQSYKLRDAHVEDKERIQTANETG